MNVLGIRSDTDGEESPYNWLTEPIVDPGHQQLDDDEIVALVNNDSDTEESGDDESVQQVVTPS